MISEHQFASSYSSIWSQIAPLSDGYWHFENMLVQRELPPLTAKAPKSIRGVVNETGFLAFARLRTEGGATDRTRVLAIVDLASIEALAYIKRLAPTAKLTQELFDDIARREAAVLALRLLHFFPEVHPTVLRPKFSGCGIVSACEGDVLFADCLYEVKAGERAFRISDLRQLLIYSALAYSAGDLRFSSIGLFNPRTGARWSRTLDQVCDAIAGMKAVDTLSSLVDSFSGVSVSR
jgi:hypothetical protein